MVLRWHHVDAEMYQRVPSGRAAVDPAPKAVYNETWLPHFVAIRSVGFIAAASTLSAVGALVVFTVLRFIDDRRWVAHTSAVITHVDQIAILERSAIALQRGYLLIGAKHLRYGCWEAQAEIPHQLQQLESCDN